MFAEVEQPDGSYTVIDMEPPTGCFYCDTCGDCLRCQQHDPEDWCPTGGRWVVYLEDSMNPNKKSLTKTKKCERIKHSIIYGKETKGRENTTGKTKRKRFLSTT